jgi:hypothetical protein
MKISIIGTGNVGSNLGKALAAKGHEIVFGVRDAQVDKVKNLLAEIGGNASAVSVPEAIAASDVIAVASPSAAVSEVIAQGGDWSGKILIDTTNRFAPDAKTSAAEEFAALARGAHVVKAFNTIGAEHYLNPQIGGSTITMFICGDDARAKGIVGGLVTELGFDLVDAGPLSNAEHLESLARFWITMMRGAMGRNFGFRLIR